MSRLSQWSKSPTPGALQSVDHTRDMLREIDERLEQAGENCHSNVQVSQGDVASKESYGVTAEQWDRIMADYPAGAEAVFVLVLNRIVTVQEASQVPVSEWKETYGGMLSELPLFWQQQQDCTCFMRWAIGQNSREDFS